MRAARIACNITTEVGILQQSPLECERSGSVNMYLILVLFSTVLSYSKNRRKKIQQYRSKYDQHIAQFEKERKKGEAVIILKWFDAKYPILDKVGLRLPSPGRPDDSFEILGNFFLFNLCLKFRDSIQKFAVDAGLRMKNTWSTKQTQLFSTKLDTELLNTKTIRHYPTSKIGTQRVSIGFGGQENQQQKVMESEQTGKSLENLVGIVDSTSRLHIDVIQDSF